MPHLLTDSWIIRGSKMRVWCSEWTMKKPCLEQDTTLPIGRLQYRIHIIDKHNFYLSVGIVMIFYFPNSSKSSWKPGSINPINLLDSHEFKKDCSLLHRSNPFFQFYNPRVGSIEYSASQKRGLTELWQNPHLKFHTDTTKFWLYSLGSINASLLIGKCWD